jgi:hypothetical protein
MTELDVDQAAWTFWRSQDGRRLAALVPVEVAERGAAASCGGRRWCETLRRASDAALPPSITT